MPWQDFFYFSKGERKALTVLCCLLSASWLFLLATQEEPKTEAAEPAESVAVTDLPARQPTAALQSDNSIQTPKQTKYVEKKRNRRAPLSTTFNAEKRFVRTEKLPAGTVVELNTADSLILKKIPGIGSTFARRIVKYRNLLGGFYSVEQLGEVYGIDAERYAALENWFSVDTGYIQKLPVNRLSAAELRKHPYVNYLQAKVIEQLKRRKGPLSGWEALALLEEFPEADQERLRPYFSFE